MGGLLTAVAIHSGRQGGPGLDRINSGPDRMGITSGQQLDYLSSTQYDISVVLLVVYLNNVDLKLQDAGKVLQRRPEKVSNYLPLYKNVCLHTSKSGLSNLFLLKC